MSRRAALAVGLLLGLVIGVWDAVAVRIENPRSFAGVADTVAFLATAIAGSALLGGLAGSIVALWPRRPGAWVFAPALGLWLFAWCGVRVHVHWFFGTPLTDPSYFAVNVGLLLACGMLAAPLAAFLGGRPGRLFDTAWIPALALTLLAGGIALVRLPGLGHVAPPATAAAPADARDVLLITLDTTRADHLSGYGYPRGTSPALDRLARRAIVWTDMAAPIPLTNPSHSSLFTGLLPREHGVRNNGTPLGPSTPLFVEELAAAGWNCAAFVSGIPLKAKLSGLSGPFAVYDDRFSRLENVHPMLTTLAIVRVANRLLPIDFVERRASRTARAAIDWLGRSRGPRFLWVHFFDAHTPYDAAPILRVRFTRDSRGWRANGRDVTTWPIADYDAELRAADRALSDLVRAFEAATGGRGVVVVTADHGEGLEQHGELAHGSQLYTEDIRVPCVVAGVPSDDRIRTALASTTELARLVPAWARGTVPVAPDRVTWGQAETFAPEGRHDQSAVWDGSGRKILVNWDTGEERAYDLSSDPGEVRPRAGDGSWADLREQLVPPGAESPDELDPEVVRRLRALGYLH